MATREIITVDGVPEPCLNVSETVGENFGANKIGDVMLEVLRLHQNWNQ